jgi:hypothetical protein
MRKTFVISESEKLHIKKMYGLVKEGREKVQEIETYSREYIDKDGCDGIATDINNLSAAVNRGEVNLSPSGRAKLEENKKDVGKINGFTCGIAKGQMKNALDRELSDESQYPDAIATACWMSKNSVRYKKTLSICNSMAPPDQNQNKPIDNKTNDKPIDNKTDDKPIDLTPKTDIESDDVLDFAKRRGTTRSNSRKLDL